jgi:hypothetical protein
MEGISEIYDWTFEQVKKAILSHPRFTGYDHERVVRQAVEVYGSDNEDRVKKAILSFPRFASLNHERVVREVVEVYGSDNEDRVKKAILRFPGFAGLNHERVVRERTKLGRMAGMLDEETRDILLDMPISTGYSAKRYLAAFDIGRKLESEGIPRNREMLKAFTSLINKSPYVPESNRERISHIPDGREPPLLIAMRKRLS